MIECLLIYKRRKLFFNNQKQLAKFLHVVPNTVIYKAGKSYNLSISQILASSKFNVVRFDDLKYEELSKLPDIEFPKEFKLWIAYKSIYKSKIALEEFIKILSMK